MSLVSHLSIVLLENSTLNNLADRSGLIYVLLGRHEVKDYCRYPGVGVRCAPCAVCREHSD